MYEIFWMAIGGALGAILMYLVDNKHFKAALRDEHQAFKETLNRENKRHYEGRN